MTSNQDKHAEKISIQSSNGSQTHDAKLISVKSFSEYKFDEIKKDLQPHVDTCVNNYQERAKILGAYQINNTKQ